MTEIAGRVVSGEGGSSLAYAATAREAAHELIKDCSAMLVATRDEVMKPVQPTSWSSVDSIAKETSPSELHPDTPALDGAASGGRRMSGSRIAEDLCYSHTWRSPVHEDLSALVGTRSLLCHELKSLELRLPALTAWISTAGDGDPAS